MADKKPYEGKSLIFDEFEGLVVFDYDMDKMREARAKLHHLLEPEGETDDLL